VLAGWRSGLVALVAGQVATWWIVVEPRWSVGALDSGGIASLAIATFSELMVLAIVALYQREVDKGWTLRERQMDFLGHALDEIDHRTRNNYQTVLALILLQAQRSPEPAVRQALQQVADRVKAVSSIAERLGRRSEKLGAIRLGDHLRDLCAELDRGMTRDDVRVLCEVADVTVGADQAICIGIIVNELITNALKHAFGEGSEGVIEVKCNTTANGLEVIVADSGTGMKKRAKPDGLGTKLIQRFVGQLHASHEVSSSNNGTTHRILVPIPR